MARGRSRDITITPSRALIQQRAYRNRKAAHLAAVEGRCQQLEEENERLKRELEEERSRRIRAEEERGCVGGDCCRKNETWRKAVENLRGALSSITSLLPPSQLQPSAEPPRNLGLTSCSQSQDTQLGAPFHSGDEAEEQTVGILEGPENDVSPSASPSSSANIVSLANAPGSPSCCDGIISCDPEFPTPISTSIQEGPISSHAYQRESSTSSHQRQSYTSSSTSGCWNPPVASHVPLIWGISMVRTSAQYDENCCLGVIACDDNGDLIS
ncbi:hypothetical protein BOTBODRAFT_237863 [Botryobasidium botryosum FD-172 SS1]|uniref:BZIP domain-containing protein n=1 Tax=Botryobasidium botryosum (strain FD-172 SS1) TaxID=930990 RepID=A0A067MPP4_BOTB1|nr:hypothetical protein BOTBODRAFT_237863 [Botryobasidium botryosum FD-172 SS1]